MSEELGRPWVRAVRHDAAARLFCFAPAGAGAGAFKGWAGLLPGHVEVLPVVLPGREGRLSEAPLSSLPALVEAMLPALYPALRRTPFIFYGHSMGAWLALELTRALRRARRPLPTHLIVAARRAPQLPSPRSPLGDLPRDAFVAAVRERYQAIPDALVAQPSLLDLFLPALRADFQAIEAYRPADEAPLPVPIMTLRGDADRTVDAAAMAGWAAHSEQPVTHRVLPGGHFFQEEQRELVTGIIASLLRR
jgi:medium-chain acyl-[acyl-carrier-protein] hydrolase